MSIYILKKFVWRLFVIFLIKWTLTHAHTHAHRHTRARVRNYKTKLSCKQLRNCSSNNLLLNLFLFSLSLIFWSSNYPRSKYICMFALKYFAVFVCSLCTHVRSPVCTFLHVRIKDSCDIFLHSLSSHN